MAPRPLAVLAAVAVTALAGCGGSQSQSRNGGGGGSGRALFAQACGACHTLTGREDPRHQGGDLLGFRSTRAQMLQLAGEMPVRHPLSRAQLDAVVTFVMSAEARGR